jgi:molecular chaperone Hsp33
LLQQQSFSLLEEKPVTFKCGCTLDRVKRSLLLVGEEELRSMAEEKKDFQIDCDFCSEHYVFTPSMIEALIVKEGSGIQ